MPSYLRLPIAAAVVAAALAALAGLGFYTVAEGERGVVLRLGQVVQIAQPGAHFKMPFVDTVRTVNVRTRILDWSGPSVMNTYSRDQQPADLTVRLTYAIKDDDASVRALYAQYGTVDNYAQAVVAPRAAQQIKTIFGQFNAVTAVQDRQELNARAEAAVIEAVERASAPGQVQPGRIDGVEIQNIDFSDAYEASIEARMQAEVEVQRVNQNLERERTQAQIKVTQAQADADAVKLAGEAEAAAIKARGEAEASAIKARNEALREGQEDLVQLMAVEKWDGRLPATMPPGATVPFIDLSQGRPAQPAQ